LGAALRRVRANLCVYAALAAALAVAGCGGERRDADAPDGTYTVDVRRASFAPQQRLARRTALVISVRNTGEQAIPNLTLTVRGFSDRSGGARNSDAARDVWIVDRGPSEATTAVEDMWTAGRLEPGRTATLRWEVTPVVAGTHELTYAIAPAATGGARATLSRGGDPRGTLRVSVTDTPAKARVDPRTGAVRRQE
jgi:hypothetical protein